MKIMMKENYIKKIATVKLLTDMCVTRPQWVLINSKIMILLYSFVNRNVNISVLNGVLEDMTGALWNLCDRSITSQVS